MVAMTLQTNLMTLDRKSAMTSGVAGTAMPARKGAMRTASASDKSYNPKLEECDDKWTSWNSHTGEDSECDYEEWTGFAS